MTDTTEDLYIGDDGTLDTIVCYKDHEFRFSSEYRFSFDSDEQFLEEVKEEVKDWYSLEKTLEQEL